MSMRNETREATKILFKGNAKNNGCVCCGNGTTYRRTSNSQQYGYKCCEDCFNKYLNGVLELPPYKQGKVGNLPPFEVVLKTRYDKNDLSFYEIAMYDFNYPCKSNNPQTKKFDLVLNAEQGIAKFIGNVVAFDKGCKAIIKCGNDTIETKITNADDFMLAIHILRELQIMKKGGKKYNERLELLKTLI